MNKDKKFLIVGLGLLGGSIAMGLKKKGHTIYAIDVVQDSIDYALAKGYIDKGALFPDPELIADSDVIISGLYPSLVVDWINSYQKYFKSGTLITDVTGVKGGVVAEIQNILRPDCEFIGAHPMAGREIYGIRNANPKMFLPANLIITPTEKNTQQAIDFIYQLGTELRFNNICELTVDEHDKMISYVSQLTHVIAVSLMNANDSVHLREYTGDSFRDLTRIAKINENLWSELFLMNKGHLLDRIDDFMAEMAEFRDILANEDTDAMKQKFITSTQRRKYFDRLDN